jgi:hypothetical protein
MTARSIHTIARARSATLIEHFHSDMMPPVVATRDIESLALTVTYGGGTVENLAGESEGIIWRFSAADDSSLWVRPNFDRYRAVYKQFIEKIYGSVDWDGFEIYDVDHLFNRARAFDTSTLLRVEAVAKSVNRQHGFSFERSNSKSDIEKANGRDGRKLTFISVLKLAGINAPRSMDDHKGVLAVENYLMSHGWKKADIDLSLTSLFEKARHRSRG